MHKPETEPEQSLSARAALMMCAKAVAFAVSFALPLLLVRWLNQTQFGIYKQVFLFVNTSYTLLPLGVGMSAFYFLPRQRERRHQIVFNIVLFYVFVSAILCLVLLARPTLLAALLNSPELTQFAPLVALVIVTWVFSSSLEMIAIANQELRVATVFVIATQFTKSVFLLTAAAMYSTVESLLYAAMAQGILQSIVFFIYLHSRFGEFWRGFEWPVMRNQLAYALPFGVASVIFRALGELDNYFVSHRFGPAVYAIYAVGCFELPLLGLLSESISSVTIPRVSHLQSIGDRGGIIELVFSMVRKLSMIMLPIYAFLIVMGRDFIQILFTAQYVSAWPIFAINLTLLPLIIITCAYDPVMRAYAEHRYFLLKLRCGLVALFSICLWFTVARFGIMGAVISMVGVNLIDRIVIAAKVKGILGLTRSDLKRLKGLAKVTLAAIAAGVVTMLARNIVWQARPFVAFVLCGFVFSLTYVSVLLLVAAFTPEERQTINRLLIRILRVGSGRRGDAIAQASDA
jgi:O-antigen/teichoic acid export membrane protein